MGGLWGAIATGIFANAAVNNYTGLLYGNVHQFTVQIMAAGSALIYAFVMTYILARIRETPDSFFGRYVFTRSHDKSIKAVAQGVVDGASVDSLIWEYLNRAKPDVTQKTRIVNVSEPYGIPPLVVRKGLDPGLKHRLRQALVNMADDPEGKKILAGMMIDRFVPGDDRNYDSVRDINRWKVRLVGYSSSAGDIYVYSMHLKASQGYEAQRAAAASVRCITIMKCRPKESIPISRIFD